ncbi:hypothetical protein F2Q70_00043820 [Brassica cretica]|uniref:Lipoyl-binding domain-containing protein n=1 Tax=Brassica cretica TaxID=69181 RepID=A0A8S9KDL6_BRACR|nr:hypothetical protein F2Q70_00043820 [Brassica cretica]
MIVGCSSPSWIHIASRKMTSPKALTEKSYAFPSCHSIQQTLAFSLGVKLSLSISSARFLSLSLLDFAWTVFSNFQGTTLQRWVRPFSPNSEPGDRVEADEAIAQIETDKVTIDIASPWCDPRVSCQGRRYCRTGKQGSYTK